jgi:alginate O-acetyltransferase complex protein AlgI
MEFNSLTFIVFFILVLVLHNLPFSWRVKKINLLWASYIFYAAWNPPFVLLLMLATVVDWFAAKGLYHAETEGRRKVWLLVTLISNLGLLGFFKYGNFLLSNFVVFARTLGLNYHPPRFDIILPIGISFYTFVTLSYTLDVYFKKMKPWNSFLDYAMLVTFFPHLVAGPILRAHDFLPQCIEPHKPTPQQFYWGMAMFVFGLFEKIILADYLLSPIAEKVYTNTGLAGFTEGWLGTMAFAGQIFCDFSGYSTCAIGIALCLGFKFPQNFRCPYAAVGFSDFWRRWHISLSSWLRDYLYIPLGGNRGTPGRACVNVIITMLLGGLWHGASWTFVVWGGLHGLYLVGERLLKRVAGGNGFWQSWPGQAAIGLTTYLLVCITWVFFRANSFGQAFHLVAVMCGASGFSATGLLSHGQALLAVGMTVGMLALHWVCRNSTLEDIVSRVPWWARALALSAMLFLMMIIYVDNRAFIYFQF